MSLTTMNLQHLQMEFSTGMPFGEYPQYTARRQPSLEEALWPATYCSTPNRSRCGSGKIVLDLASNVSTAASTPDIPPASPPPGLNIAPPPGLEHVVTSVPRLPSLDDMLQESSVESRPVSLVLQDIMSDMDSLDSDTPVKSTVAFQKPPKMMISLSDQLGISSVGSAGHASGTCKPCAFIWKDGCASGANCQFCHMCPPGEVKRRKKDKTTYRKMARGKRDETGLLEEAKTEEYGGIF
eukprot:gnl/MRDRNA2_/MRDRNA2_166710_c0_seq1.p1 gnl/MRDRNA2_/MRDRNA2_166710_c0~~gnl/MRDRNA2_/MRDRNA2_166710_c0_seq1.p1  ORF type:complete len:239 (-),score=44.89 gnl/MRDRNA2_/MRDRNA2_166710_c0_seq1:332-1048(-)